MTLTLLLLVTLNKTVSTAELLLITIHSCNPITYLHNKSTQNYSVTTEITLHLMSSNQTKAVLMPYFHFRYDTEISALNFNQYHQHTTDVTYFHYLF